MIAWVGLLLITSCNKDFLEKQPDENLDIEAIFSERRYAEGFLTSIYFNIPGSQEPSQDQQRNPFTGASDEMEITWT